MAKSDSLTYSEFIKIRDELLEISDTWADLWMVLFLIHSQCSRIIKIRYSDIREDRLHLPGTQRFLPKKMLINSRVKYILKRRKESNPDDIYVFQSRSNRVKFKVKPVTAIAMNMAIKKAASSVTDKNVSMKSALNVTIENKK